MAFTLHRLSSSGQNNFKCQLCGFANGGEHLLVSKSTQHGVMQPLNLPFDGTLPSLKAIKKTIKTNKNEATALVVLTINNVELKR